MSVSTIERKLREKTLIEMSNLSVSKVQRKTKNDP
jgi:hypothetical protein